MEIWEKANGDFYAWSKIGCEWILSQDDLPFRTLLVRLPGVVGPGCGNPWLNRVADALLQNLPVKLYNLNTMFNNALHVDDLCQFIGSCLDLQWENDSEIN